MADDTRDMIVEEVDESLEVMKLEEGDSPAAGASSGLHPQIAASTTTSSMSPAHLNETSRSPSSKNESASQTPKSEYEAAEIIAGDIIVESQPGKPLKLRRTAGQKVAAQPPPLFNDLPDVTDEALQVFHKIKDCIYGSKYMGSSGDTDILDCECKEDRDASGKNHACNSDEDCINRATKMECGEDADCGDGCQNQRFQRRQYANVSVIKTEKKGYGLRANTDLKTGDFVFEYIGEVINEPVFRRRTVQYHEEGVKHFYFMSLTKHEFVDATKKGNLGRFCNHSCNPNCYVDKWVVGEKLRMGIFAERNIQKGEELVFNYNVDRYGADPQPCYCAEPNCTGYLGGKTQTERATKLSHATIEALGIDDGDGWDTAVAKKPRKKKTGEDDEEYVNNVQAKGLDEDGVKKVMATLMQCKEKWIVVKLLDRIQRCDDDRVRNRVIQMHGYQILRSSITNWKDDNNVVLQILDILYKFPRLTRNKISDSKIEAAVELLTTSEHEDVAFESKRLIEAWSKLEVAYRIPRKKFDPAAAAVYERRSTLPAQPVREAPVVVQSTAPSGPRSAFPLRPSNFAPPRPPPFRRPYSNVLPSGWFAAESNGSTYYYSKTGLTTWVRPTIPVIEPPPPPPKEIPESVRTAKALQDIIDQITKPASGTATPAQATPQLPESTPPKEKKKPTEKWRSLSEEKQMKLYENTLFPHIKHVMQKFSSQLPKDDLKKFAKEVGKKLVASDFKNKRVDDPTKISPKQEKKVKQYVKEYFEKAVAKKRAIDKKKREREKAKEAAASQSNGSLPTGTKSVQNGEKPDVSGENVALPVNVDSDVEMSDDEDMNASLVPSAPPTPLDSPDLKRKRDPEEADTPGTDSDIKRLKEDGDSPVSFSATPPPPPPPPPADFNVEDVMETEPLMPEEETEEQRDLRLQEEELQRENEEAILMDLNGSLKAEEQDGKLHDHAALSSEAWAANNKVNGYNGTAKPEEEKVNGMAGLEESEKHGSTSIPSILAE